MKIGGQFVQAFLKGYILDKAGAAMLNCGEGDQVISIIGAHCLDALAT